VGDTNVGVSSNQSRKRKRSNTEPVIEADDIILDDVLPRVQNRVDRPNRQTILVVSPCHELSPSRRTLDVEDETVESETIECEPRLNRTTKALRTARAEVRRLVCSTRWKYLT